MCVIRQREENESKKSRSGEASDGYKGKVRHRVVSGARLAVSHLWSLLNRLSASHVRVLFLKLASLLVQHVLMGRISFLKAFSIA